MKYFENDIFSISHSALFSTYFKYNSHTYSRLMFSALLDINYAKEKLKSYIKYDMLLVLS